MIGSIRLPAVITFAILLGTGSALAQSIGPDEMVTSHGAVSQTLALTAAQKSAIYNLVMRARVRSAVNSVPAAVGAPVSPAAELHELPDQGAMADPSTSLLKYTVVANEVVVVDPIEMRVVDIIHDNARP